VRNGLVVTDRVFDSAAGGDLLDALLLEKLMDVPSGGSRPELTIEQVNQLKEMSCHMPTVAERPDTRFVLPDGTKISLAGREHILADVPDFLFAPASLAYPQDRAFRYYHHGHARDLHYRDYTCGQYEFTGLQSMLASSFATSQELEADLIPLPGGVEKLQSIRDLGSQLVLAGGCTRIPGFMSRLNDELLATSAGQRLRKETDCKRLSWYGGDRDSRKTASATFPNLPSPKFDHDAFAGAAIMASTAVPHWVSKAEYLDRGSTALSFHCD